MSSLHSSSQQRPRSGTQLKGLPLLTVVTLSGVALFLGRSGPAAAGRTPGGEAGDVMASAPGEIRQIDRRGASADQRLAPVGALPDGLRSVAASGGRGAMEPLTRASGEESLEPDPAGGGPARGGGLTDPALTSVELDGTRAEGPYHLGVREGEWSFFDRRGILRERGSYRAGKRDGAWLQYARNGRVFQLAEYVDGAQEGSWQRFSREGALLEEGQFEASVQQGRWVRRYSNGSIKERGLYEAGLREGLWEFFDDVGRPTLRTGTYRAGVRID